MADPWTVVETTGQRIDLERGLERKEIRKPSDLTAGSMFMQVRPGELIDDATIEYFLKGS